MSKLSEIHAFPPLPTIQQWKNWILARAKNYDRFPVSQLFNQLVCRDVHVGIEVEVENSQHAGPWDEHFWDVKDDNSLRNSGREWVSCPLVGEQIIYALLNLEQALGDKVSFSQRTSIHIHMNVRELTPEEVAKLLLVYLTVEKLCYRFIGNNRDKNIFCVPLYDLELTNKLFNALKGLGRSSLPQGAENRYSGLNFDPTLKFGTVEFRQMHGTSSTETILTWINIIFSLRNYAVNTSMEDLIKEILALNTNSAYKTYAHKIFQHLLGVFPEEYIDADVGFGVLSVKRTLFSDKFGKTLGAARSKESPAYKTAAKLELLTSSKEYQGYTLDDHIRLVDPRVPAQAIPVMPNEIERILAQPVAPRRRG